LIFRLIKNDNNGAVRNLRFLQFPFFAEVKADGYGADRKMKNKNQKQ